LACGSKQLDSIATCAQTDDASVKLCLEKRLTEVLVHMKQHDLTISTTNADLVVSDGLNASNTLGAHRLAENKHLVFYLIGAKVT
jgi:hypothetical protein